MLQKEHAAGSCTSGLRMQGDLGLDLQTGPSSVTRVLSASQWRARPALEPGKLEPYYLGYLEQPGAFSLALWVGSRAQGERKLERQCAQRKTGSAAWEELGVGDWHLEACGVCLPG